MLRCQFSSFAFEVKNVSVNEFDEKQKYEIRCRFFISLFYYCFDDSLISDLIAVCIVFQLFQIRNIWRSLLEKDDQEKLHEPFFLFGGMIYLN